MTKYIQCHSIKVQFVWDERKNIENQSKHRISFEEAQLIFNGTEIIEFDSEHSKLDENRFKAFGFLKSKGHIVVVFIEEFEDLIKIISARKEWRGQ